MMGAGKTAVGMQLARDLAVPFLDTDHEIETAARRTIPEIFARDGESFFRARESEVLSRLLQGPPAILSTGGGAFLRAENRELIARHGVSVWLRADLPTLWARVKGRGNRPLLQTPDPRGTLAGLLDARAPVYAQARLVIDSDRLSAVETTAAQLRSLLANHTDILEIG